MESGVVSAVFRSGRSRFQETRHRSNHSASGASVFGAFAHAAAAGFSRRLRSAGAGGLAGIDQEARLAKTSKKPELRLRIPPDRALQRYCCRSPHDSRHEGPKRHHTFWSFRSLLSIAALRAAYSNAACHAWQTTTTEVQPSGLESVSSTPTPMGRWEQAPRLGKKCSGSTSFRRFRQVMLADSASLALARWRAGSGGPGTFGPRSAPSFPPACRRPRAS